jgi:peptidoglycan hydrolase-like protein with peptidoglycan-binding domain
MKFISLAVATLLLAMPLSASADQMSDLQAQVQVLSQLLAQLQQQKAVGGQQAAGTAPCPTNQLLGPGSSGSGVSMLQEFLAADPSVYPQALVTGYYGSLTISAVQAFQVKNNIVSSGDPSTTGYGRVGPHTLAVMLTQCISITAGAPATGQVGGFMQVSPVSGAAPLQVTVEATVNTTNNCGASTYTIDFGDGSQKQQIIVPAGTCQTAQQTYTHTYSTGSYTITLSAGNHSSTALVTVQ